MYYLATNKSCSDSESPEVIVQFPSVEFLAEMRTDYEFKVVKKTVAA
jgi:hypothetical protein